MLWSFINEVDEAQSLSVHGHENELLEELMMKDLFNPRPLHFFLKELQVKANKEKAKHPLQATPSSAAACHYKSSSSVLQDKKLDHQVDHDHDQDQDQDELDALFWDDFYNPRPLHVFLEELNELNDKQKSKNAAY